MEKYFQPKQLFVLLIVIPTKVLPKQNATDDMKISLLIEELEQLAEDLESNSTEHVMRVQLKAKFDFKYDELAKLQQSENVELKQQVHQKDQLAKLQQSKNVELKQQVNQKDQLAKLQQSKNVELKQQVNQKDQALRKEQESKEQLQKEAEEILSTMTEETNSLIKEHQGQKTAYNSMSGKVQDLNLELKRIENVMENKEIEFVFKDVFFSFLLIKEHENKEQLEKEKVEILELRNGVLLETVKNQRGTIESMQDSYRVLQQDNNYLENERDALQMIIDAHVRGER